jgi:hypothetical protein
VWKETVAETEEAVAEREEEDDDNMKALENRTLGTCVCVCVYVCVYVCM